MPREEMDKYELKRILQQLESLRGRNTELVSLYIPAGYNLNKIMDFLTSESSEAENIKSKQTRKNVQSALDKLKRRLKDVDKLPENGVALFCGNTGSEGKPNIQLWEIVPPQPIQSRIYRCDKTFVLEPIRRMVSTDEFYVLISLDRSRAAIGTLKGKTVQVAYTKESKVPGKQKAGGFSQQRFARIRESVYKDYLRELAEKVKNFYLDKIRQDKVLGVIVGGPGFAKEHIQDYLHSEIEDKVIAEESTNYASEEGIDELVTASEDVLEKAEVIKEKKLVNHFLENLKKENGRSIYGLEQVTKALKMGAVDKVLLSEDLDMYEVRFSCPNCGEDEQVRYLEGNELDEDDYRCRNCQAKLEIDDKEDLVTIFRRKAEQVDSEVELISDQTPEGQRLQSMGGIAAILRYRIN